jgi:hypothetical protein
MGNKIIATIELDNGKGRGKIIAKLENNDFFQAGGQVFIIYLELPDGTVEQAAVAPQRKMADVENTIEAFWGHGWDLQWEKA